MFIKFIETPLGKMAAKADEYAVLALDFVEKFNEELIENPNEILWQLQMELNEYFAGKRREFSVPVRLLGSDFQIKAWKILQTIPFGKTVSYSQQAKLSGNAKAVRAVANANSKNKILLLVPCHRVIGADGSLTGFSSGLWRKEKLLELEKNI
jgi:O-6-methylguanine DNA methyltransferase